jgi:hypothetical protein
MRRIALFILIVLIASFAAAQSTPTPYQIAGQNNFPCADGYYSHAEHTEGACYYHGGFAAVGGGSGGDCGTKCAAIIGGAVAGTAIAIMIYEHHLHNEQTKQFCTANPTGMADKKHTCEKWMAKHNKGGK